jgi:single-strand DNA-binding protein
MSKDLNQCNFIGRIGKDIDLKYMPNGNAVANFSIACGDDYKDKNGQKVEQTNWINIVLFGKRAEVLSQYCGKGSRIFVTGKQTTRKWQDQSGADRYTTEVVASDFQMLDGKSDGQQNQHGNQQGAPQSQGQQPNGYQQQGGDQRQHGQTGNGFDDEFSDDHPF